MPHVVSMPITGVDDLTIGDPVDINVVTIQPVTPAVGWRCPGCQQCFAPATPKCDTCGQTQGNGHTVGSTIGYCTVHGRMFDAWGCCPVCDGRVTG
jgi:hypothetical protein